MLISLNFTSFSPWTHHTLWIRNLVRSALRVCLIDKLPSEINTIKGFALWDDFPKSVVNSIINKILNTPSITEDFHDVNKTSNEVVIYFYIHHSDGKGCPLIKSCIYKLNKIAKKNDNLPSEFYMTSQKLMFSVATKIKRQHQINHYCLSLCVLGAMLITLGKL